MALTEIQRNRLLAYIQQKDRETEPVYVGRGDLFDLVADNARSAARGRPKGLTTCIAGPPGIGKTAFLDELDRQTKAGEWDGPPMACIPVDPDTLRSPGRVLDAITKRMPRQWRRPLEDLRNALRSAEGAGLGGGFAGFTLSAGATWRALDNTANDMPWEAAQSLASKMPGGSVLCLVVDEAQALSDTPGSDHNVLLRSLHMARSGRMRVPIFVLLAGLTHAPKIIEKSISRLAVGNKRFMNSLSDAESMQYANGTLDHFRVSQPDFGRDPLVRWIANECGGFPHHLRNAMSAIAEGLLDADSLALSDIDGPSVMERLRKSRVEYYEVRTEDAIGLVKSDLGKMLRKWSESGAPPDKDAGRIFLHRFLQDVPSDARALMKIDDGDELMTEMVKKGVLMTDSEGGGCRCPIDSLAAWMESGKHCFRKDFPKLAGPKPRRGTDGPFP